LKSGFASLKSSATRVEIGSTVELPETTMESDEPLSPGASDELAPPQAATAKAATRASAPTRFADVIVTWWFLLGAAGHGSTCLGRRSVPMCVGSVATRDEPPVCDR